jgi:hypothetical protein
MALKPDRDFFEDTDIMNYWINDGTQDTKEKGGVASVVSSGSGVAMDASGNVVSYVVDPSGAVPKGVLLHDVNPPLSATRDFRNYDKVEARPGDKVSLVRKGWLVTDFITGTPAVGGAAYLGASGLISTTQASGTVQVGRFETTVDADGFARVYIDI